MSFSLQLYTPIIQGTPEPVLPLDGIAFNWERSTKMNGGCWQGSFNVFGSADELRGWFDNALGGHVVETSGGVKTWEGMIFEMKFISGNVTKVRSLDTMVNRIKATYLDDGETKSTDWVTNDSSIARFGQREDILKLDEFPLASAEARRSTFLNRYSWPRREAEAIGLEKSAYIKVIVRGYVFTLNWLYVTAGSGLANVSDWIATIIGQSEFLTAGRIDENTIQVTQEIDTDTRAWDLITEYILLGDDSYNPWRLYVDLERRVHYHAIDMAPGFIMSGGLVYLSSGSEISTDPWNIRPGVFRDVDEFLSGQESGSCFLDVRDFIVDEVTVDSTGGIAFSPGGRADSEFLAALQHYAALQDSGGGDGGGGGGFNKWHWPDMTDEEREWWSSTH